MRATVCRCGRPSLWPSASVRQAHGSALASDADGRFGPDQDSGGPRSGARLDQALRWLGFVALFGLLIFPTAATGLVAPGWGVALVTVVWVGFASAAWWVGGRRPRVVPLLAVLYAITWWSLVSLGGWLFGWTA